MTGMAADKDEDAKDTEIAKSLAAMLGAGLTVISRNQERINNPDIEDKGLDGKTVLAQAAKIYQETTDSDPTKVDQATRHGRLLHIQMDAIIEVMDTQSEDELNQPASASRASSRRRSAGSSTKPSAGARSMMPK